MLWLLLLVLTVVEDFFGDSCHCICTRRELSCGEWYESMAANAAIFYVVEEFEFPLF